MNVMDQWLNWVWQAPFSGNVDQNIAPNFLSPKVSFNFAGDAELEGEIVQSTASYGKQLSAITDVLLEVTEGSNTAAVNKLRELNEKIEQVKEKNGVKSRVQIEQILDQMDQDQRADTIKDIVEKYT